MRIGVDIDGTVADFSNKFTKYMARNGKYILNKDVFKYMDDYAIYESAEMDDCFSLDFYPNATLILAGLFIRKNEMTFLTKRGSHSITPEIKSAIEVLTIKWQQRHFKYFTGIIFTKDKTEYASQFDVMIEDDAGNANAMAPYCTVLLLTRGWNRDAELHPNVIVVENWREIKLVLADLEKFKTIKEAV